MKINGLFFSELKHGQAKRIHKHVATTSESYISVRILLKYVKLIVSVIFLCAM